MARSSHWIDKKKGEIIYIEMRKIFHRFEINAAVFIYSCPLGHKEI
jgi:hypothetical protein